MTKQCYTPFVNRTISSYCTHIHETSMSKITTN
jgi:hypothetical protein